MARIDNDSLDRWITGNWGENQFPDPENPPSSMEKLTKDGPSGYWDAAGGEDEDDEDWYEPDATDIAQERFDRDREAGL